MSPSLLKKAKGVYIVPDFGRGGLIVGGRGGAGVMLAKHNGRWTDPAFFNFGGVSIGAQAGGSGGSVAFILMSQDAVDAFKNGNQFSLNSGAGLSIVNYSANAQASAGKGDIVFWSNTEGRLCGRDRQRLRHRLGRRQQPGLLRQEGLAEEADRRPGRDAEGREAEERAFGLIARRQSRT